MTDIDFLPSVEYSVDDVRRTHLFDHDAEDRLIGCVLISGDAVHLSPEAFHKPQNRPVWAAIQTLVSEGRPIDLETVALQMDYKQMAYVGQLAAGVGTALYAGEYARRVEELYRRRRLVQAAVEFERKVRGGGDVVRASADLQELVMRAAQLPEGAERANGSLSRVVDEVNEVFANPRDVWGMRTGWQTFDLSFGGMHKGEVFVLAGEPKAGKTILATQLGYQLAGVEFYDGQILERHPGAIYSMEMSKEAIHRRLLCSIAQVDYNKLRTGRMTDAEHARVMDAVATVEYAPVFISGRRDWTTVTLKADVARLMEQEGIEWVVVDYAGLLKDDGESDNSRQDRISKGLHDLAGMGVAVVAVETLNKSGLRGETGMGSVYGSVAKVYDADLIAGLERDRTDGEKSPKRTLKFLAAREGDAFLAIDMRLNGPQKRFDPWHGA